MEQYIKKSEWLKDKQDKKADNIMLSVFVVWVSIVGYMIYIYSLTQ